MRLRTMPTLLVSVAALVRTPPATIGASRATAPPRVERLREIGCADCEGPTRFGSIYEVALSVEGRIIVVTDAAPMIRIFDSDGTLVKSGLRQGAGPGELQLPLSTAIDRDGSIHLVDLRLRRITHLDADLRPVGSHPMPRFPIAAAARPGSGDLLVLTDDFRGHRGLEWWPVASDTARVLGPAPADADGSASTAAMRSIAVARTGEIAITDGTRYRIRRIGPSGEHLADIAREVARMKRTTEEQAELDERLRAGPGHAASERRASKEPASILPRPSESALTLKPHFGGHALRYDDAGRLWALTMRGDARRTVFDVFDPSGTFLGEVTLPARVQSFALGGGHLVTSGENADGVPIVTLWSVR